jgi:hypothetical protein
MKTVPFSDILASVCQLVGLDRNTLNDKSFGAVRDLCGRRMSIIWDREEWPDTERVLRTFPGNPIQTVEISGAVIITEFGSEILMENGQEILMDTEANTTMKLRLNLETATFPRVYLSEFTEDAYKKNAIGETLVKVINPFYITAPDGTKVSASESSYKFTYNTLTDGFGEYITDVDVEVPIGTFTYPTYGGVNHPLTSKLVFTSNLNLIVMLQDGALQGLNAFNNDPRNTTRTSIQPFIVEDFNDKNDVVVGGTAVSQEYSYLRFFSDGEKFISYRKPCPRLFGGAWSGYTTYSAGGQAFYDPYQASSAYNPPTNGTTIKGNFWDALAITSAGVAPANTSSNWSMVEIPYRFKDYLVNGVSADFLRSEGRPEEANLFDQLAESAVQQQIDVLLRQQGQVQRMDMAYTY